MGQLLEHFSGATCHRAASPSDRETDTKRATGRVHTDDVCTCSPSDSMSLEQLAREDTQMNATTMATAGAMASNTKTVQLAERGSQPTGVVVEPLLEPRARAERVCSTQPHKLPKALPAPSAVWLPPSPLQECRSWPRQRSASPAPPTAQAGQVHPQAHQRSLSPQLRGPWSPSSPQSRLIGVEADVLLQACGGPKLCQVAHRSPPRVGAHASVPPGASMSRAGSPDGPRAPCPSSAQTGSPAAALTPLLRSRRLGLPKVSSWGSLTQCRASPALEKAPTAHLQRGGRVAPVAPRR